MVNLYLIARQGICRDLPIAFSVVDPRHQILSLEVPTAVEHQIDGLLQVDHWHTASYTELGVPVSNR